MPFGKLLKLCCKMLSVIVPHPFSSHPLLLFEVWLAVSIISSNKLAIFMLWTQLGLGVRVHVNDMDLSCSR